MTKSDMNNHRDQVDKRNVAREIVGKARKPRSDKGIKRLWNNAPGVGEDLDNGDKEDNVAPPAKRMKAASEPHITTTKKAPKTLRKSRLPPTCLPAMSLLIVMLTLMLTLMLPRLLIKPATCSVPSLRL